MRLYIHHPEADRFKAAIAPLLPAAEILDSTQHPPVAADYLAVFNPTHELLAKQEARLKAIINLGAGVDALITLRSTLPRVPVYKLHDAGMAPLMLDYVLYAITHFTRSFDRYAAQAQRGEWQPHLPQGKSDWPVGVLGLGAIGAQVAQGLAQHGYPTRGYSRSPRAMTGITTFHGAALRSFMRECRIIVNLLPATPATDDILDAEVLGCLQPDAVVINPGRGSTLVLDDLLSLIDAGHIRGAALDVFPTEPLARDSPLWHHPKLLLTPHIAAPTLIEEAARQAVDYIKAMERGAPAVPIDLETGY